MNTKAIVRSHRRKLRSRDIERRYKIVEGAFCGAVIVAVSAALILMLGLAIDHDSVFVHKHQVMIACTTSLCN